MHSICVPLSFGVDEGENSTATPVRVYLPTRAKINKVRCTVVATLSATDAGTVELFDSADTSFGSVDFDADEVIEARDTITPTDLIVEADDYILLTPTKTTAGGEVLAFVEWQPAVFTAGPGTTGNSVG